MPFKKLLTLIHQLLTLNTWSDHEPCQVLWTVPFHRIQNLFWVPGTSLCLFNISRAFTPLQPGLAGTSCLRIFRRRKGSDLFALHIVSCQKTFQVTEGCVRLQSWRKVWSLVFPFLSSYVKSTTHRLDQCHFMGAIACFLCFLMTWMVWQSIVKTVVTLKPFVTSLSCLGCDNMQPFLRCCLGSWKDFARRKQRVGENLLMVERN